MLAHQLSQIAGHVAMQLKVLQCSWPELPRERTNKRVARGAAAVAAKAAVGGFARSGVALALSTYSMTATTAAQLLKQSSITTQKEDRRRPGCCVETTNTRVDCASECTSRLRLHEGHKHPVLRPPRPRHGSIGGDQSGWLPCSALPVSANFEMRRWKPVEGVVPGLGSHTRWG